MRVLILDDISLHRQALAAVLDCEPTVDAVTGAADHESALRLLAGEPSKWVVLLNATMTDGTGAVAAIVRAAPGASVIAMAVRDHDVIAYAEAGVAGYLLRDDSLTELMAVISSVARGETQCSPRIAAILLRRVATLSAECRRQAVPDRLTARELEVLQLVDEGLSNKQIASRLSIDIRTVKNHVHHILEKFQVHRRSDAAARFRLAQKRP